MGGQRASAIYSTTEDTFLIVANTASELQPQAHINKDYQLYADSKS